MREIKKYLAILMAALLVFAISGCSGGNANKTVAITTSIADNRELETTLNLSGVLTPAQTVDISSKISGQVIKLSFHAGSGVKAGDILMHKEIQI
jgi:multidrug efflux pump subunit AcrA (membrane-fusion protein)